MSDKGWTFPNALAEQVRRLASQRGQHANRAYSHDERYPLPTVFRVYPNKICQGGMNLVTHSKKGKDPFCHTCGFLLDTR